MQEPIQERVASPDAVNAAPRPVATLLSILPFLAVACGAADGAWFQDRSAVIEPAFVFESGSDGEYHLPEISGGGVGLLDYDGDADLDILLLNGGRLETGMPVEGADGAGARLLRNDGDWSFVDVTVEAGLSDAGYNMGMATGDVNDDGWVDIYLANYGPDQLLINQGDGRFVDQTGAAGIAADGWASSAAMLDYDRDGDLDIYVARYGVYDPSKRCTDPIGRPNYCGPQNYEYVTDLLLRNEGATRFSDQSEASGIADKAWPGLGVVAEDFDQDGWIDIYVANDGTQNLLWRNLGDGRFSDEAVKQGAALDMRGVPQAGMGVTVSDFDRDGWRDIFVTNLNGETNNLYRNLGAGVGFTDSSSAMGLAMPSVPFTGFGVVSLDIELDGDSDLFVANGEVRLMDLPNQDLGQSLDALTVWERFAQPNQIYLNRLDEEEDRFVEMDDAGCGPPCTDLAMSRGIARGDLDRDGDLDLVLGNIESPARIYENVAPRNGHWLRVRAVEPGSGRDAIGARLTVEAGGRRWTETVSPAQSYLSASDPHVAIGLGEVDQVDQVLIHWPDGSVESFAAACVDCELTIRRGEGRAPGSGG